MTGDLGVWGGEALAGGRCRARDQAFEKQSNIENSHIYWRCPENVAPTRQSRPDYGHGVQVKVVISTYILNHGINI